MDIISVSNRIQLFFAWRAYEKLSLSLFSSATSTASWWVPIHITWFSANSLYDEERKQFYGFMWLCRYRRTIGVAGHLRWRRVTSPSSNLLLTRSINFAEFHVYDLPCSGWWKGLIGSYVRTHYTMCAEDKHSPISSAHPFINDSYAWRHIITHRQMTLRSRADNFSEL